MMGLSKLDVAWQERANVNFTLWHIVTGGSGSGFRSLVHGPADCFAGPS